MWTEPKQELNCVSGLALHAWKREERRFSRTYYVLSGPRDGQLTKTLSF